MVTFGAKPQVNPFGKMSSFRLFELLVFKAQKGVFSFQNIVKDILQLPYIAKKKVSKMAILRPKPWIKPFGKMSIFRLFVVLFFYRIERRFFVLEYRKGHFSMVYCRKKKLKKRPIFGPKPWLNLFGKVSIFKLFEPVFLQPKEVFFRFRIS